LRTLAGCPAAARRRQRASASPKLLEPGSRCAGRQRERRAVPDRRRRGDVRVAERASSSTPAAKAASFTGCLQRWTASSPSSCCRARRRTGPKTCTSCKAPTVVESTSGHAAHRVAAQARHHGQLPLACLPDRCRLSADLFNCSRSLARARTWLCPNLRAEASCLICCSSQQRGGDRRASLSGAPPLVDGVAADTTTAFRPLGYVPRSSALCPRRGGHAPVELRRRLPAELAWRRQPARADPGRNYRIERSWPSARRPATTSDPRGARRWGCGPDKAVLCDVLDRLRHVEAERRSAVTAERPASNSDWLGCPRSS